MKLGRKTTLTFLAEVVTTVVGFAATLYFARVLGDEILGTYFLVIAVVLWLKAVSGVSVETAVEKRISEGSDPPAYFTTGLAIEALVFICAAALMIAFRERMRSYVDVPVVAILAILLLTLVFSYLGSVLQGNQRVHVSGLLQTLDRMVRAAVQVALVVAGYKLTGLLVGHAVGVAVAGVVAAVIVSIRFGRPERAHFENLFSYAKYSWLGGIRSRTFASVDTLVLGLFVSTGFIGVYEIAWNIASVLVIFSTAIVRVMFPTISAAEDDVDRVAELIEDAMAFTGLFVIPGLIGAVILGREILGIYGPAFQKGALVLVIHTVARLVQSYSDQFTSALMAIDRPDLSFRINVVFVAVNVALNFGLIATVGWVGAAVATAISATVAFVLSFRTLRGLVRFRVPTREIGNQVLASLGMGAVVVAGDWYLEDTIAATVALVGVGATIYLVALLTFSPRFRKTVARNLYSVR